MNTRSLRFRMTAWYAALLAGALGVFSVSVYVGLERYLYWNLQRNLGADCRSIATQFLALHPFRKAEWLRDEIEEAYSPAVNARFIRVVQQGTGVVYVSGAPKDGAFDPSQVPLPVAAESNRSRKLSLPGGHHLLITAISYTAPDGTAFVVESGMPYHQVEVVLDGLLETLAIYTPFLIALALVSGYWLMRRSLQPVDEITRRAEGITSTKLSERLPVIRTGDELERLSVSLNRMIERLDQAFQHVHRFSADASHELRTPLTVLQLELESMAQANRQNAQLTDQLGSALEETQRMSRIVDSLLALSRLDAGDVKMERVRLDLGALASSTAEQMRLLADEKKIAFRIEAGSGVFVEGDRSRLQQVIVNLVANAIKYTPEAGEVEVTVRAVGESAILEVTDKGVGIAATDLPHVFERFYRADKARSRASGGSGLGLAIVKAICAAHGADVTVSSQEGRGSRFTVTLPKTAAADSEPAGIGIRA